MSITTRIVPGAALDASVVTTDFADIDNLTANVADAQFVDSSVDYRHLPAAVTWKLLDSETYSAATITTAPNPLSRSTGSGGAIKGWTVHATDPLIIIASFDIDFGTSSNVTLQIRHTISGTPVVLRERYLQLLANQRVSGRIVTWWDAPSSTPQQIELWVSAASGTFTSRNGRIEVLSPTR